MQLTNSDLEHLCGAATSAALKAGNLISSYSEKELEVKNKGIGDSIASQVVTEVDLKAQELILQMLAKLTKHFDLGTLAEESTDNRERFEKDYFWSIDPIDGTLAFINHQHGYSVSIALVSKHGEPVVGVIFDPLTKNLYSAIKGQGAFRNGRKWEVKEEKNAALTFIHGVNFPKHKLFDTTITQLQNISQKLGYQEFKTKFQGGAALIACWVLEEAPACYFSYPKKELGGGSVWDYAASACIYQEAGGWASDLQGNPLDLNRPDSTFLNHRGILFATNKKLAQEIIEISKVVNSES